MAEPKSWVEVVLMPVVIAVVGLAGTVMITHQQDRSATTMSEAQLASAEKMAVADRQVKILDIFAEKVASKDEDQRLLAVRLLKAIDADLAEKIASAVLEGESTDSNVSRVAVEVAQDAVARASLLPRVYVHIRDEGDRAAARKVAEELASHDYAVPGIERLVDRGPSASQLRYFRESEKAEAERIVEQLKQQGVTVTPTYIRGYEGSDRIRANHFELWFAKGEPKP